MNTTTSLRRSRRPAGDGSVYRSSDGIWHASISLGFDRDGRRLRRHAQAQTRRQAALKLAGLKADVRPPATVGEWAGRWLRIIDRVLRPATVRLYQGHLRYLEPLSGVGLSRLKAEDLEFLYRQLSDRGLSPPTVASVHRTVRSCLNEAVRRGHLDRNPALVARPPRAESRPIDPLSLDETRAVIDASRRRRNGVRWQLALTLGIRQGEALGLQWDDIDLDSATLRVRRSLGRAPWKHGCQSQICGQPPWRCPQRHGGGLVVGPPKTTAGMRIVALSQRIIYELGAHRRTQTAEQVDAGAKWQPPPLRDRLNSGSGWVFTTRTGGPIDASRDRKDWKQLLTEAKVADYRVHDARHSAATFMLQAGVETRTVMDTLGWVQPAMLLRYQHVPDRLRRQAAERIDLLLWGPGYDRPPGGRPLRPS